MYKHIIKIDGRKQNLLGKEKIITQIGQIVIHVEKFGILGIVSDFN